MRREVGEWGKVGVREGGGEKGRGGVGKVGVRVKI